MMAMVDEHNEQLQQHEQLHQQQGLTEREKGSLSRASFVQAAAGSVAAVLALSLVSLLLRYFLR